MKIVKTAKYFGEYKIEVDFKSGEKKIFDMEPYINEGLSFIPLKQKDIFKMFKVEGNTVSWITGADISPDFIYEKGGYKKNRYCLNK